MDSKRHEIEREIRVAFAKVTRKGGVSWSETRVIDSYGTEAEAAEARLLDRESSWTELADDPKWDPNCGIGGFSFLDPIGFRYYLPAAMIKSLREGPYSEVGFLSFQLTLIPPPLPGPIMNRMASKANESDKEMRAYILKQWSALDDRQRRAVRSFLAFMAEAEQSQGGGDSWQEALNSYWHDFENIKA